MEGGRELLIVSNRGPLGYELDERGERIVTRGAGGLVTSLRPLVSRYDVTWVASALTPEERRLAARGRLEAEFAAGAPFRLRFVAHDPAAYDLYYNVVANPALWFVQHGLWGLRREQGRPSFEEAWADGYLRVNEAFASVVLDELECRPRVPVFFQDYHLYVAPRLVRERQPSAVLAQFVHVPWPRPEEWRVLPEHVVRAVHDGLLANDLVGFHTEQWRSAFLDSCGLLGLDTSRTLVTAHAISVDPAEFDALAASPAVLESERALLARRPEQLIVRVDRTDPSKNIVRGLQAFGLLLDRRPDLRGAVGMLALLDPSRQLIPEYLAHREQIESTAAEVERRHPGALELSIADDFPQSLAAYKQYDVLLVNAVRDGLNLVAKEASLVNQRDGVVVLSENTGAFEELAEWVVGVDPYDLDSHVAALEQALALGPDERRSRAAALRAHVRAHDLDHWVSAIHDELRRVSTMRA